MMKNLAYIVDIETDDPEIPYENDAENVHRFVLQGPGIAKSGGPCWSAN